MPSKGTTRRAIRADADLWERFGQAVHAANPADDRSSVLRGFMAWFSGDAGAELPLPPWHDPADPLPRVA